MYAVPDVRFGHAGTLQHAVCHSGYHETPFVMAETPICQRRPQARRHRDDRVQQQAALPLDHYK